MQLLEKIVQKWLFSNEYWDNHEAGIYVDVATGEPLFLFKKISFDSGCGSAKFLQNQFLLK